MFIPPQVVRLLNVIWDGPSGTASPIEALVDARAYREEELRNIREDHVRQVNPTPYKVRALHNFVEYGIALFTVIFVY